MQPFHPLWSGSTTEGRRSRQTAWEHFRIFGVATRAEQKPSEECGASRASWNNKRWSFQETSRFWGFSCWEERLKLHSKPWIGTWSHPVSQSPSAWRRCSLVGNCRWTSWRLFAFFCSHKCFSHLGPLRKFFLWTHFKVAKLRHLSALSVGPLYVEFHFLWSVKIPN